MNVTGLDIQYYFYCHRKLWYHYNHINMERNSQLVAEGKLIDEKLYVKKNNHVFLLNKINVDLIIDSETICEIKKTMKNLDLSKWQLKYYLYCLQNNGVNIYSGDLIFPHERQRISVTLTSEDCKRLKIAIKEIENIILSKNNNFHVIKKTKCNNCAFYDLCFC